MDRVGMGRVSGRQSWFGPSLKWAEVIGYMINSSFTCCSNSCNVGEIFNLTYGLEKKAFCFMPITERWFLVIQKSNITLNFNHVIVGYLAWMTRQLNKNKVEMRHIRYGARLPKMGFLFQFYRKYKQHYKLNSYCVSICHVYHLEKYMNK